MSNLAHFRTAVETAWVAATPPTDGSSLAYRFVDDFIEEKGGGQHRELIWRLAKWAGLAAQHEHQNTWTVTCELVVFRTPPGQQDRTYRAWIDAVEAEAVVLELAFSRMGNAAWDPTVLAPVLQGFTFQERDPVRVPGSAGVPRSRVAIVTFTWQVLVQEG